MVLTVAICACVFAAALLLMGAGREGERIIRQRLRPAAVRQVASVEAFQEAARKKYARKRPREGDSRFLSKRLMQAGLPPTPATMIALGAILASLAGIGLRILLKDIPVTALGACAGAAAPFLWVEMRRLSRMRQMDQQLPGALDMVASALRAGHAFSAGLEMASAETAQPLAAELRKAYEEQSLGLSIDVSLRNLSARVGTMDCRLFTTAVIVQREVGGNLAEVLDRIKDTVLRRITLQGQLRALTAQGRYSGWILSLLPVVLGVLIYVLNPGYMSKLTGQAAGRMMLAGAAFLQAVGCISIRRIIRLRY